MSSNIGKIVIGVSSVAFGSSIAYHFNVLPSIDDIWNIQNEIMGDRENITALNATQLEAHANDFVDGTTLSPYLVKDIYKYCPSITTVQGKLVDLVDRIDKAQSDKLTALHHFVSQARKDHERIERKIFGLEKIVNEQCFRRRIMMKHRGFEINSLADSRLSRIKAYLQSIQGDQLLSESLVGHHSILAFLAAISFNRKGAHLHDQIGRAIDYIELGQPLSAYLELSRAREWDIALLFPALVELKFCAEAYLIAESLITISY